MESSKQQPDPDSSHVLPPIESLPVEVIQRIMGQLVDFAALKSFVRASPSAVRVLRADEGVVCKSILIRMLGDLSDCLPIAIARREASKVDWRLTKPFELDYERAKYNGHIAGFCDRYLSHQATKLSVTTGYFTLDACIELTSFHDRILEWISIMTVLMYSYSKFGDRTRYCIYPTALEKYRTAKMLYATEIVSILLPIR
ncbi:hypothetical protein F4677DRAFT_112517 [Hypoxylon crocopeplum]|nr:hypothetical protein F4677DRAFT_112517 [Hypoxylon crocopeplum]